MAQQESPLLASSNLLQSLLMPAWVWVGLAGPVGVDVVVVTDGCEVEVVGVAPLLFASQ